MKKLLMILVIAPMVGCSRGPNKINGKYYSYKGKMHEYICSFETNHYGDFEDSCAKYYIGDTTK